MSNLWVSIGVVVILLLLGAVFFGAPYVPTRRRDIEKFFSLVKKRDVIMDLGSGDGRLVKMAAEKGMKAYGVELSPLLALVSWLSLGRARERARISWGNYWRKDLPADTTVVFVFLADAYMQKLRVYLETQALLLNRPLTLISYGFELPGYTVSRHEGALLVYQIRP